MGFRTTITTNAYGGVRLPRWFVKKWQDDFFFGPKSRYTYNNYMLINSKFERKMFVGWDDEIITDIQKVCKEKSVKQFVVILLHECGGITRVEITPEYIKFSEPTDWKITDGITHCYCYGCSDTDTIK